MSRRKENPSLISRQFLSEEAIRFILGLAATTLGVLIALLINSGIDKKNEKATYETMVKAINLESIQNNEIYENSFKPNYKNSIIRRHFLTKVCDEYLANKIFLNNTSDSLLTNLITYTTYLKRANNFRDAGEKYQYDPVLYARWGSNLEKAFENLLPLCNEAIIDVYNSTK